MHQILVLGLGIVGLCVAAGYWLGWQLLRQNGRILLRLDDIEKRLEELEFAETREPEVFPNGQERNRIDARVDAESLPDGEEVAPNRAARFKDRSLARSRIDRNGLKAGTSAPSFRLPQLDGSELSLEGLRGKRLLLVFSDTHCGPCNALAPQLEKFHREQNEISIMMISRGEPKENRAKVKEHGLTFPIVLQQRWEISRLYAMFGTPIAYLIDETGVTATDVAVGLEPILALMCNANGVSPT
jgi:peroxiredoxin